MRTSLSSFRLGPAAIAIAATALLVACSSSKTSGTTTTTVAPDSSSPAATDTGGTGAPNTTTGVDTSTDPWSLTAKAHQGKNGSKFQLACPAAGKINDVWGTETYTDDSSICSAAVHVGLITVAKGGKVEYQITPGKDAYVGSIGNGVTSNSYAKWPGSFIFPAAPPGSGTFTVGPDSWSTSATTWRGENGLRVTVQCSPNGVLGSVYGTGTYTDDSSVCTAAVHSGVITQAKGGTVVIAIAAGQSGYKGSTANGVTTNDYASWDGTFSFPKDQTPS